MLTVLTVALPRVASAQRTDGAIGVSLIILPPDAARTARVTTFHIDRDGMATLRTAAPAAAHASRIVTTRVTSSASGLVTARYGPPLPCAARERECAERELRFHVDVDTRSDGIVPRDVELRVEYLVVAGT